MPSLASRLSGRGRLGLSFEEGFTAMLTYYKARALADALEMLERPDVEGRALLGGTDLLVSLAGKHDETPRVVVDLKGIKDWGEPLVITDTGVRIGLMLTMAELAADPVVGSWYPALTEAADKVGSVAIRNRATVVGNICNASPASDSAPPLLVHEATVRIASASGQRSVPISSFFVSPRVAACARGDPRRDEEGGDRDRTLATRGRDPYRRLVHQQGRRRVTRRGRVADVADDGRAVPDRHGTDLVGRLRQGRVPRPDNGIGGKLGHGQHEADAHAGVRDDQRFAPVLDALQVHHDPRGVVMLPCQGDQEVSAPEQGSSLHVRPLQHLQSVGQGPCLVVRQHLSLIHISEPTRRT